MAEPLTPDWQQPRPSPEDVEDMWKSIDLVRASLPSEPFGSFIEQVRKSHDNGGVYLAAFDVGPDRVFDWYASRNRLYDDGGLEGFVTHCVVREALPELRIPNSIPPANTCNSGFRLSANFYWMERWHTYFITVVLITMLRATGAWKRDSPSKSATRCSVFATVRFRPTPTMANGFRGSRELLGI